MPKGVSCSVSNCSFWKENNLCGANNIQIEIDSHSTEKFSEEFSQELVGVVHQDHAKKSKETCCLTFKPRG